MAKTMPGLLHNCISAAAPAPSPLKNAIYRNALRVQLLANASACFRALTCHTISPYFRHWTQPFMAIADFIRDNTGPIIKEWENFAKTFVPAAEHMSPLARRNHIVQILAFIEADISTPQTAKEQVSKSHGDKPRAAYPSAAETHAALRHDGGFNMDQMVSEYRALRASVVKLWKASKPEIDLEALQDLTRFHEAVDQAMTESIHDYSRKLDLSRNLFLGILSHDLRNPLGAISMSAQLAMNIGALTDRQTMLLTQITDSTTRAGVIVTNLLDLTRARLGTGLPIVKEAVNMAFVSNQLVDEVRAMRPTREIRLKVSGDVSGLWDKARIGQVFSNLLGNAVQYGFRNAPISVTVDGQATAVVLTVHNEGVPIAPDDLATLFNSLTRVIVDEDLASEPSVNLGLGLYICKEIVVAHGGTIAVTSTERDGTTFTVRFPRTAGTVAVETNGKAYFGDVAVPANTPPSILNSDPVI